MKQLKSSGSAPGFARETGFPKSGQLSQKQAKNTQDQARPGAPNRGQTATSKGGRGKGGND